MFEKEAEKFKSDLELIYKKGVLDGYNKAKEEVEDSYRESLCNSELNLASVTEQLEELEKVNEWHYVKDGLPKDEKEYLVIYESDHTKYIGLESYYLDTKEWSTICKIIAWKEIVLPKESE